MALLQSDSRGDSLGLVRGSLCRNHPLGLDCRDNRSRSRNLSASPLATSALPFHDSHRVQGLPSLVLGFTSNSWNFLELCFPPLKTSHQRS